MKKNGTANMSFTEPRPVDVRDTGVAQIAPFLTLNADEEEIVFGVDYAIYIYVASDPSINVFTEKFRASCPAAQFQVAGEKKCRTCPPDQGICDGTPVIRNQPGYWRISNKTTDFIKCRIPSACPEGRAAAFGAAECSFGYQGAMCDDCIDGYGKDQAGLCAKCPSMGTSAGILAIIVLFTFVFLFFMIILAIQNNPIPTSSLGRATVLIALFATTQQTMSLLSFLGVDWPSGMRVVLNIAAFLFEFRFYSLHAVNCLFREFNMNDSYAFLLFVGITLMVIPMIFLVKFVLRMKPRFLLSRECGQHRDEFNAIARKSYTGFWHEGYVKEHLNTAVVMSCVQIFVFYLIQIDMYYLLSMLQCVKVGTDDLGHPVMLMNTDVRVNCNSDSYNKLFAFAITCAIILGGGATFGFFTYMGYYRYRRYEDDFQAVWSFMSLGLKEDLWFWNCSIIFRKIMHVLIVSFLKYPISLYCYVWTMMVWSWVEYEKKPYIDQDFNQLSTVFNLVLVFSGNMGMTVMVVDSDMTLMILDFLNVAVIVGSMLLFVWKCSRMFILRYMEVRAEARREFVDDIDEKEIEGELQKRHDEEAAADKQREEDERQSLEKIQKEMRAAAAAAAGTYSKNPDFDDFDEVGLDKDGDNAGKTDTFSSMMDQFYDADRRGDDKRSTVSKSDDRASFVPGRSGVDEIEMTRKSDAGRNSETASAYSTSSKATSKLGRGRGRRGDDQVAQTSYVPNQHKNSAEGADHIDDTINSFLSGFDEVDADATGSPSSTVRGGGTDLSALIKTPAGSPTNSTGDGRTPTATIRPFNHYEAAANSRSGAFGDDGDVSNTSNMEAQFNRPTFVDRKISEITDKSKAPALPVSLPPIKNSAASSPSAPSSPAMKSVQPLKPLKQFSSPSSSSPASPINTPSHNNNSNTSKPALPVPLPSINNRNGNNSQAPPPPPVPVFGLNKSLPKLASRNATATSNNNNNNNNQQQGRTPLPSSISSIAPDLAKSLSKVQSKKNKNSNVNSSNPFMKGGGSAGNWGDSDDDIL